MTVSTPRVLVVSESRITRRVVEMTFADQPVELVVAADGRTGLEQWQAKPPAVLVVDFTMGPPDGLTMARQVRDAQGDGAPPVILMAGQGESVDDAVLASAGVRGVLRKPLDSMQLIDAVRGAIRDGRRTGAEPAPWRPAQDPPSPELAGGPSPVEVTEAPSAVAATEVTEAPAPVQVEPSAVGALLAALGSGAPASGADDPAGDLLRAVVDAPVVSEPSVADALAAAAAALEPAPEGPAAVPADALLEAPLDRPLADEDLQRVAERVAAIWSGDVARERQVSELVAERVERVAPAAANAAAERLVRELAPAVVAEVARLVVADVSERLVREEIARMRSASGAR
ncbi:MAG: response regulator [Vicinamibacterales bacterium]